MDDVDYELIPESELEYLRKEIAKIKKDPFGGSAEGDSLKDSIDGLSRKLRDFILVLQGAKDELGQDPTAHLTQVLSELKEQNALLAKGILMLSDSVTKLQENQLSLSKAPSPHRSEQTQSPSTTSPFSFADDQESQQLFSQSTDDESLFKHSSPSVDGVDDSSLVPNDFSPSSEASADPLDDVPLPSAASSALPRREIPPPPPLK
ncbi:MAG: hypothetical protein H6502_00125 [Candidatus Woesearchaeota archaeon]|nr:MAG: hypothetical protein H6502_00125 [Candidatus Woesearchaeota archaeon]